MRFVVLGDLHYSFYADPTLTQGRELFYDNMLTDIVDLQPDLVFSIGDAVNEGRVQEFEGLLNQVKKRGLRDRFLIVTGNHDVLKNPKISLRPFLRPPAKLFQDYVVPDSPYYAFDYDVARFVVLDTTKEMNETDWGGLIDAAQLEWLKEEVAAFNRQSLTKILVVLAHHPIQNTTSKSNKEMLNISNSAEVWQVLAGLERGQGLYFNGHNHVDSIAKRANWYFVQAGALYCCADYRVCDITTINEDDLIIKISTKEVGNGSDSSFELANRLGNGLEHFSVQEQPKGTETDRYLSIKL